MVVPLITFLGESVRQTRTSRVFIRITRNAICMPSRDSWTHSLHQHVNFGIHNDILTVMSDVHGSECLTSHVATITNSIVIGGIPKTESGLQLCHGRLLHTTSHH